MCQAIAQGGRRCPRHRRDSIVAMQFASSESGLPLEAVNELFTELRREARHVHMHGMEDSYEQVITTLQEQARAEGVSQRYRDILTEYDQDSMPAADTLYALTRLRRRAIEQSTMLQGALGRLSERAQVSPREVRDFYEQARADASDATSADEHSMSDQQASFERGLPTDPASVTAYTRTDERFSLGERGPELIPLSQLNLITEDYNTSERFSGYGFDRDSGYLEVHTTNGATLAYREVPASLVDSWGSHREAAEGIQRIMESGQHRFNTPLEAEQAGFTYRCTACGQFRALSHECPEREVIDQIMAENPDRTRASISDAEVAGILATRAEEDAAAEAAAAEAAAAEVEANGGTEAILARQNGVTPALDREAGTGFRAIDDEASFQLSYEDEEKLREKGLTGFNVMTKRQVLDDLEWRQVVVERQSQEGQVVYMPQGITKEEVEAAPENTKFFIARPRRYAFYTGDNQHVYISPGFDSNKYMSAETATHSSIRGQELSYMGMPYRTLEDTSPLKLPLVKRGIVNETRYESRRDFEAAYVRDLAAMSREQGDNSVSLSQLTNYSRAFRIREGHTPRIAWAKKPEFRRAINDGKVAIAPITWNEPAGGAQIDEFGYDIETSRDFTVTGNLGMKRKDDGTFSVETPETSLQCDCSVYQRNYHCTHIDYVRNHAPKLGQQMMQSSTPNTPAVGAYGIPVSVVNHRGVTVSQDPETERTAVAFTTEPERQYRARFPQFSEETISQERDLVSAANLAGLARGGVHMPPPTIVARAARNAGTVSAPFAIIGARDPIYGGSRFPLSYSVYGTRVLSTDENGEQTETIEQLRCSCGRFTSGDGTCPHTILVSEHSDEVLGSPSSSSFDYSDAERQRLRIQSSDDAHHIAMNSEVYSRLVNGEITEEQLADEVRAAEEERERQERERAEEYERMMRERRALLEEERRRMALSMAERNAEDEARLLSEVDYSGYRAGQKALWENVDERYGDNTEAVKALIEEAQSETGTIGEVVGYRTENVTDGVCDPSIPGSRRFGVELEFVLPSGNKGQKLNAIARELHEAGLADRDYMGGYHSGRSSGWSSWNLESDCTVDGELVSPLMADTPEHWEQLDKALTILKRHGAKTSTKAGSHVHVSSGSFIGRLAKGVEVLRTVEENEDVLFRAAADPKTGAHRGTTWCAPNVSTESYGDVQKDDYDRRRTGRYEAPVLSQHTSHRNMINMEGSVGITEKAHIEYRMWDASLDAATIQKQVMASVAITESADRDVENNGGVSNAREVSADKKFGSAKSRVGGGKSVDDTSVKNLAAFVDRVFRRKEDREDFIRLYATKSNA